jgi:hypothetical protein
MNAMSSFRGARVNNPGRRESRLRTADDAAQAAARLLLQAIEKIVHTAGARDVPGSERLLFPNGIELIRFSFKVGTELDVSITFAGEKAPKEPAHVVRHERNDGWVSSG